jgi:cytidylate kinase
MAVITISRQYGSGGDEIAVRVCEILGYHYFDKTLMNRLAADAGLAPTEIVDFSEDNYKIRGFLDRLLKWRNPKTQVGTWTEDPTGARVKEVIELDEARSITFVQGTIQAAYRHGNLVILGRGGQAILKGEPDVLHVRIEAPLDARDQRIHEREKVSLAAAQDIVVNHDRATADYLKRFYNIDWANPSHYDLVINTGKLGLEGAAQLIVKAVSYVPATAVSA